MYSTLSRTNLLSGIIHHLIVGCAITCISYDYSIASSSSSSPAEPLVTDRPDQTESSHAVPVGAVQVELGATLADDDGADRGQREFSLMQTLVRTGVAPGLELRIGFDGVTLVEPDNGSSSDGVGDMELGLKIDVFSAKASSTTAAILGGVSLPTGQNDFSAGGYYPSGRLSIAHDISEVVSLGYNLGVLTSPAESIDDETDLFGLYTVALGAGVSPDIGVYLEVFGEIGLDEKVKPSHALDGGMTYLLAERTQLDFSGGVGLSDSAGDWYLSAGVSFRLLR